MVAYTDTFAGSGALGVTEGGGLAWEAITGSWSRSGGYAAASTNGNASPPPIAVVDLGVGQVDLSAAVSNGGGDALYFRVTDANNWFRARVRKWQTSSTYYYTEYRWYHFYEHGGGYHLGDTSGSPTGPGSVSFVYEIYNTSPSSAPSFPLKLQQSHAHEGGGSHSHDYDRGSGPFQNGTRQASSTSYNTNYQVVLEKCVNGTVTTLGTYSSSATSLRVRADGTSIVVYVNGTSRISVTDATHQSATKHGIGRGPSEYQSSAIDNFSAEPLIPPTPTITAPANNSTVTTGTPTLQTTVTNWGGALTKVEYQIASDAGFTADLKTLVEPNEAFRASGSYGLKILEANLLTQRGWFVRARQVSESGLTGNWTTANAFTVAHSPGAVNLQPTGGGGVVVGATNRLSWQFTDTSETDSQTAYRVVVERNDTSAPVLDTGKLADAAQFHDITVDPSLKDVQLRWRVMVWDEEDKPSSWTNYHIFIPTDIPVVTMLEPLDGANVGTSRPLVRWSFAASGGRSQASHRVTVSLQGLSETLYDSGLISGSAGSHEIQSPVIQNAKTYDIKVYATDSLGITVVATSTVAAVYEEPDVVDFSVDDSYYLDDGYVRLTWQAESDPTFRKWRIYRRRVGTSSWKLLGEISQISVTEYRDWLVPSQTTYDYYVVQVVERFNEEVESVVGSTVRITLGGGGYWLIDSLDSRNNMRLHNVTAEDYTLMNEQAEYNIVGRGRHVDEGEEIGRSGTMTCQLRHSGYTTASEKLQTLEGLRRKKLPLYLRNPFGAIIYVALGDVAVSRIAGVGDSEFVDVTVPYLEVF